VAEMSGKIVNYGRNGNRRFIVLASVITIIKLLY